MAIERAFPTRTFTSGDLTAEYHDASMCTFDGRFCVVASISKGRKILDVAEFNSPTDSDSWVRAQLLQRTGLPVMEG